MLKMLFTSVHFSNTTNANVEDNVAQSSEEESEPESEVELDMEGKSI